MLNDPKTATDLTRADTAPRSTGRATGRSYGCLRNVNCQSANLIDVITCRQCGIQYVGQTKNRLLTRFQGHYFDIRTQNDTTVVWHFNRCVQDNPDPFDGVIIPVVYFVKKNHPDSVDSKRERDAEETPLQCGWGLSPTGGGGGPTWGLEARLTRTICGLTCTIWPSCISGNFPSGVSTDN